MLEKKTKILLGVIPARGGSKGIKNKNIKKVRGKPLIFYTIKHALNYRKKFQTIVTTDSLPIAHVARKCGATVPFIRPKRLAKDGTAMLDVLKHALVTYEKINAVHVQGIILFDPTSPLRKKGDIDRMIALFVKKKPDLVVAVTKSRRNPYFNMVRKNKDGYAQLVLRGTVVRRQDAPKIFDITNTCWIFSRQAILRGWRIPKRTMVYETHAPYVDIDTKEDFKMFEQLLKE
ncbi:MAG: acylneuraminate cytidylyltransferase family protein [Candidatus Omnitrophica bacterium]|nr:acylneuraminate cytidylyltransferase family protein [Candidatus Omnitrophota bacterium]